MNGANVNMFKKFRPVWAEINLDNLAYNIQRIRDNANSKEIIGVVKSDAYGHGAIDVGSILLENGSHKTCCSSS